MRNIRLPCVAGTFYEGKAEALKTQIEECFLHKFAHAKIPEVNTAGSRRIVGLFCPHAGYEYSGPVAANAYFELALDGKPDMVVILGPNHRGYGSPLATASEGSWRTPLGEVEIDGAAARMIAKESRIVDIDDSAHIEEHSIEVQLPFLQYLYGSEFKFVPICFQMQDLDSSIEIGKALAKVLAGKNAVVIASSDMTHYEPQKDAAAKDSTALKAVKAMDEKKFYSVIAKHDITACGYGPITSVIVAAKGLGAKEADLLCYRTSGEITGDYSSVVGYAAVNFRK